MNVFQSEKEVKRLNAQEEILRKAQDDIIDKYLRVNRELCILDIGSNDGYKTKNSFGRDNVLKVVGIEYSKELVEIANRRYGNEKFSFSCLNVEDNNFIKDIKKIMIEKKISGFNIIHISLVLLHLNNAKLFIERLRELLKDDGILIIIETEDEKAKILGDDYYIKEYNKILKLDPLMGNREVSKNLPLWIKETGYADYDYYYADNTSFEYEVKKEMYEVYFLAVKEDLLYLSNNDSQNKEYERAINWLDNNLSKIKEEILKEGISFGFGVSVFVVRK